MKTENVRTNAIKANKTLTDKHFDGAKVSEWMSELRQARNLPYAPATIYPNAILIWWFIESTTNKRKKATIVYIRLSINMHTALEQDETKVSRVVKPCRATQTDPI